MLDSNDLKQIGNIVKTTLVDVVPGIVETVVSKRLEPVEQRLDSLEHKIGDVHDELKMTKIELQDQINGFQLQIDDLRDEQREGFKELTEMISETNDIHDRDMRSLSKQINRSN